MIELDRLSKHYAGQAVVDAVRFGAGDLLAIRIDAGRRGNVVKLGVVGLRSGIDAQQLSCRPKTSWQDKTLSMQR